MRTRELPNERVQVVEVALAERLRVTAKRLLAMPPHLASSLSVMAARQAYAEADVRRLAATLAAADRLTAAVEAHGDIVTVTFRRARGASR